MAFSITAPMQIMDGPKLPCGGSLRSRMILSISGVTKILVFCMFQNYVFYIASGNFNIFGKGRNFVILCNMQKVLYSVGKLLRCCFPSVPKIFSNAPLVKGNLQTISQNPENS